MFLPPEATPNVEKGLFESQVKSLRFVAAGGYAQGRKKIFQIQGRQFLVFVAAGGYAQGQENDFSNPRAKLLRFFASGGYAHGMPFRIQDREFLPEFGPELFNARIPALILARIPPRIPARIANFRSELLP